MAVEISSKKGIVSKAPYELFMLFTDMRNFVAMLPEDKKEGVTADEAARCAQNANPLPRHIP